MLSSGGPTLYFQCVIKQVEALAPFLREELEVAELFLHYALHAVLLLLLEQGMGSHTAPTPSLPVPTVPGSSRAGLQDEPSARQDKPVSLIMERADPC